MPWDRLANRAGDHVVADVFAAERIIMMHNQRHERDLIRPIPGLPYQINSPAWGNTRECY